MSVDSFQEQQDNSSICEQSKLKRKTFRQKKQEKIIKEAKKMYEIENQERKNIPRNKEPVLTEELFPKHDFNQV